MSDKAPKMPSKRLLQIWNRVEVEGRTAADVARELGVRIQHVWVAVCRVRRWIERGGGRRYLIDDRLLRSARASELHLARLEHQWDQLMNAWYRSTQPAEAEKGYYDGNKVLQKAELMRRTQTGNIDYLIEAQRILVLIAGMRAAAYQQETEEHIHVEVLTIDQRRDGLTRLIAELRERQRTSSGGAMDRGEDQGPEPPGMLRAA